MIGAVDLVEAYPFGFIAKQLVNATPVCLLTVIKTSGSVPQKVNACAVVGRAGLLWGTVGGGRLEGDAIRAALDALESGEAFLLEVDLADPYAREAGPICGGRMKIFGRPMNVGDRELVNHLAERNDGFVRMSISGQEIGTLAWSADTSESDGVFSLPIRPRPKLIVVGAGHCGRAIAELGCWLGFATTVVDERDELLVRENFPQEVALVSSPMSTFSKVVEIDSDSYLALVSMGHRSDAEALEACLESGAAYIGMIGSRRKIGMLKKHFIDGGLATEAQWERLAAPIGLQIGAESVREIAVSVLGEIVGRFRGLG